MNNRLNSVNVGNNLDFICFVSLAEISPAPPVHVARSQRYHPCNKTTKQSCGLPDLILSPWHPPWRSQQSWPLHQCGHDCWPAKLKQEEAEHERTRPGHSHQGVWRFKASLMRILVNIRTMLKLTILSFNPTHTDPGGCMNSVEFMWCSQFPTTGQSIPTRYLDGWLIGAPTLLTSGGRRTPL